MKYILLIFLLAVPISLMAEEIDISDVQPDITKYQMADIGIDVIGEKALVTYFGGYMDGGEFVHIKNIPIWFINQVDDPDTPEDETSTEFTQFYQYVNNQVQGGKTLKEAVNNAVKIKLGI